MKFRDKKTSKSKDKKIPAIKEALTKGKSKTAETQGDLVDVSTEAQTADIVSDTPLNKAVFDDCQTTETAVCDLAGDGAVGTDDAFCGAAADSNLRTGVVGGCLQLLTSSSPSSVEAVHHEDGTVQLGDLFLHRYLKSVPVCLLFFGK